MSELVFEAEHNGRSIDVPIALPFHIRLEENPSTGYKWSAPNFDAGCIKLISDQYTPYKDVGIGGGGVRDFEFVATSACRTTVRVLKKRPWEASSPGQANFELTIVGRP